MTLILASHVGKSFCITTGDTLTAFREYEFNIDGSFYRQSEEIVEVTKDAQKATLISDYVLWGAAGSSDIIGHIKKELMRLTDPEDSLLTVTLTLDSIIKEMRVANEKKRESNVTLPCYYQFLDTDDEFVILLNGFEYNGKSGFSWYISGHDKEGLKKILNQFIKVHTLLSFYEPNRVSEICEYKVLKWRSKKEKPKLIEESIDVSKYYDELGLTKH
ncbi:hypothetical protein [Viridibacillus arvi]|uniref:hypothetical protein n=1 Tax=Viridibacillus arvi TaxID=263475 RepID=UPI003D28987C